ncbi:MAG: ATP-dependent DNA helicase RecG [Peptostreptococcaceae bacterium]
MENLGLKANKIKQFNDKGIFTLKDLISFKPRCYYDFTNPKNIRDLVVDEYNAIIGKVLSCDLIKGSTIKLKIKDKTGDLMSVVFFNKAFLANSFKVNREYIFCGKVTVFLNSKTISNPILYSDDTDNGKMIFPIYSKIKGMSDEFLQNSIKSAINLVDKKEYLPEELIIKYKLMSYSKALRSIHFPKDTKDSELAVYRNNFDRLYEFNNYLLDQGVKKRDGRVTTIKSFKKSKELMDLLPFNLTDGQREVLRDISRKMKGNQPVNGLVQGDVGCGKTIVSILLSVVCMENGYQACLVAPTNILAKQHFKEALELLTPLGFNVEFLSAETKKREANRILKDLESGNIDLIVGTHSLMTEKVVFKDLGIAIIDEEHRFGVNQRDLLKDKTIHNISMSATPIPRTLAMSTYGNIDIFNIKTLPNGRKPIKTEIVDKFDYKLMLKELEKGRQVYIVCPLISKSDEENAFSELTSVEEEFKKVSKLFKNYNVDYVNSSVKEGELEEKLVSFKENKTQILIATTIIEVGVNVPNSTIILIKDAERFGFAQVHQLRGRVGRGEYQSYCYLESKKGSKFAIFEKTTDGFLIADADLKLRGSGDIMGIEQSGVTDIQNIIKNNLGLSERIMVDLRRIRGM